MKNKLLCFLIVLPFCSKSYALSSYTIQPDTVPVKEVDEVTLKKRFSSLYYKLNTADSIHLNSIKNYPLISINQYLKGEVAGVYTQESSGEPGTNKNLLIHGLGTPIFSNKDVIEVQPAVFVNGVPIARDNNFTYPIQQYQYTRLGPATDNFAGLDIANIQSIEVIKDPVKLAQLGPLAANGAIWILTKAGMDGRREISFDSYYGINTKPVVTPINAQYENLFRMQFYNKYASINDRLNYPGYLSDSTNVNYWGPSNWNETYYRNSPLYYGNLGIRGGSSRANFSFFGGYVNNSNTADETNFKRYNALFNVNMAPFEWINIGAVVNANRNIRDRNRSLRDRFGEAAYVPDISVPLSPNKDIYNQYLSVYKDAFDNNITNSGQALLTMDIYLLKNLKYNTSLGIDYSEGYRDIFYPSSLMETNNYMSSYFGYNQRYVYSNKLIWDLQQESDHKFNFTLGSNYQEDLYRYSYGRAYDGPNDFVKINVVEGNSDKPGYLQPVGGLYVNRWSNREDFRMHSIYWSGKYQYKNQLDVEALLRYDGASTIQPNKRWLFTPAFSAKYHLVDQNNSTGLFNRFDISAGWAKIGKPVFSSRFAGGPNYGADLNWGSEAGLVSYNGFAVVSRPYTEGWVGYNMDWPYTTHANLGLDVGLWNNRVNINLAGYVKTDANQMIHIPVPAEYGYSGQFKNGMKVRNTGVDFTISSDLIKNENSSFAWNSSLNLNYNKNKLVSLPNGIQELIVNDRKLKIGHAIDQFWLYENQGIYANDSEVPVQNGNKLQFDGVDFHAGDPIWKDQNNDFAITQDDRVLKGNAMPKLVGAFNNRFNYKNFDLNFQFYFALGQKALNQRAANKYDFINNELSNSLTGIREVFHWQQDVDITKYPIYNPWSSIVPYRVNQDLFLENASFLKLRSVSLGYDFSKLLNKNNQFETLRKATLYASAMNLLTLTKFSGSDPELINFNGYYTGYGLPLSPIFTLGIKLEL